MLTLPSSVRVFLAVEPVDMRGSFDALAGRVRAQDMDPQDGHLYVFMNRRRGLMKVLFFDRSGSCQVSKRLERGTFQVPAVGPDGLPRRELTPTELGLILEGVDLRQRARRARLQRAAG